MIPNVYELLNVAGVRAVTGIGKKIFPHGTAPQEVVAPYVTFFVVNGSPENSFDGPPLIDNVQVQVDCWTDNTGESAKQLNELGTAVRNAVESRYHITSFSQFPIDLETKRYRISMTFNFWNHR